ncbi:unnamed protein product [Durusdinium trenchii]|uniref:Thioredoxin-like fold domain-containing protein n=1 Tax=Durusdinium trenchii TaxID=1381693 RepID=A0ABP0R6U8_9DINO
MVKHWRCRRPIWLLAALLSLRGALPPAPPLFAFSPGMNKLNDLAEKGDVDGALHQLRRVLAELPSGHRPTVQMRTAFNTGIKACANAGNLKQAERLFAEMLQHRVAPNLKGLGKMMEAAAKVGNLSGAEHWFRQHERYGLAHESDEIARGQLIQAAAKAQDLKAAEEWFQELLQKGLQPSAWTLAALLEACARVGDVGKAKSLVAKCTALGIRTTDLHEFLLRKVYVKNNDLDSAEEQFRQISAPDLKDYAMVIDAAARCGNLTAAEQWFRRAQAGAKAEGRTVVGDEPMFVTLMFAAARAAELQRCEEWFQQAQKARLRPSSAMYTALVTAAAEALDTSAAQRWLQACPRPWPPEVLNTALRAAGLVGDEALAEAWAKQGMKDGMRLDSYSYRALLTGAARSQDTKGAQRWFQKALQEGEVEVNTCNAAIQAAARAGDVPLAKEMLKTMNQLVVQPDAVSYQGLLTSASNACDLAACEAFVAQASASGVPVRYAPVISCAAKVQGLKEAERWFQEALHSDSVDLFALNALVAAAARVGQLELAERYLHLAREMGEEPDIVTYTSLISAATTKGDLQALGHGPMALQSGPLPSATSPCRPKCIPHRLDFVNQPLTVAMGSGASSGDRSVDVKSFLEALLGETLLASTGVVETDKAFTGKKQVGLYFAAERYPRCKTFTPKLKRVYEIVKDKGLEIVFCSSDKKHELFEEFRQEMPWLALPFESKDKVMALKQKFKVTALPRFVLVDAETGELITEDGRSSVERDPKGEKFPWKIPSFEEALPSQFHKGQETVGKEFIEGKTVGLLFSGGWTRQGVDLASRLANWYAGVKADVGDKFEIIYCGCDTDELMMTDFYKKQQEEGGTWLAVPMSEQGLLDQCFGIRKVPAFVIVDAKGQIINKNAKCIPDLPAKASDFPFPPPPIGLLSSSDEILKPAMCLMLENCEEELQNKIIQTMNPIAEKYVKAGELLFFAARRVSPVSATFRTMANLPQADEVRHVVVAERRQAGRNG